MAGAQEVAVDRAHLIDRDALDALDLLLDGRYVADVVDRILRQEPLEVVDGLAHRVGAALLESGDPLVLHDLELALRQRGLAEDLAEDLQHGGEVGALGLDRVGQGAGPAAAAAHPHPAAHATAAAQPGEVLVEGVLDLLAGEVLRPAEHQAGQEARRLGLALEVLGRCRTAG